MRMQSKEEINGGQSLIVKVTLSDEELPKIHDSNEKIVNKIKKSETLQDLAHEIRERLKDGVGYCVVEGLQFEELERNQNLLNVYIIGIANLLGAPTQTDKKEGHVVWPIKVDFEATGDNLTYSQHRGAADLHTDTQYFPKPEEVIALWCLREDKGGNGENILVDGREVIQQLIQSGRQQMLSLLKDHVYPFRVPTAFTETCKDECVEVFVGPILSNVPLIRYRKQTIDRARIITGYEVDESHISAMNDFDDVINQEAFQKRIPLKRGQVLFVNNHEILHGRTAFTDPERHLLRIRLNLHQ